MGAARRRFFQFGSRVKTRRRSLRRNGAYAGHDYDWRAFGLRTTRVEPARRSDHLLSSAQDAASCGLDEEDERHSRVSGWTAGSDSGEGSLGDWAWLNARASPRHK